MNSGRISAAEAARAKSTRHGTPAPDKTTFAGVMSRCITPRWCIPATARARSSPSPIRSPAASGLVRPARLAAPASSSTTDPGYPASSASCATPATPRSRFSTATSCRTRRSASSPSGSLRMTVRPGKNSRMMRVRSLSCTISGLAGGSRAGSIASDLIRHLPRRSDSFHTLLHPVEGERGWSSKRTQRGARTGAGKRFERAGDGLPRDRFRPYSEGKCSHQYGGRHDRSTPARHVLRGPGPRVRPWRCLPA
jgi:hypothetical protein